MNNKHTPGPWAIRRARGHVYIRAEHDAEVARMGGENVLADDSSAAANARLIAAAPELLEALRDLVSAEGLPAGYANRKLLTEAAQAAIVKATGGWA